MEWPWQDAADAANAAKEAAETTAEFVRLVIMAIKWSMEHPKQALITIGIVTGALGTGWAASQQIGTEMGMEVVRVLRDLLEGEKEDEDE